MPKTSSKSRNSILDGKIGAKIKHHRLVLGLSQEELAKIIGVKYQQIQKYESGTNRISAGSLFILSKALNVPIDSFLDETQLKDNLKESPREAYVAFQVLSDIKSAAIRRRILSLIKIMAQSEAS